MFTLSLLLATSALTPSLAAVPAPTSLSAATTDPPIRVWFNSDGNYALGDRAKVYAKAAEGGFLVVLRADAAGRVRMLFPVNPQDEQLIGPDKKYEIKGRGGREAFVADDTNGHGTVLAAISESPFQVDQFVRDGHWNTEALSTAQVRNDPEVGLLGLVQQMSLSGAHFDYDVATYVTSERYYNGLGWWGYDPWYGLRVGFGFRYRPWHF